MAAFRSDPNDNFNQPDEEVVAAGGYNGYDNYNMANN